jgi:hypothetical protein
MPPVVLSASIKMHRLLARLAKPVKEASEQPDTGG